MKCNIKVCSVTRIGGESFDFKRELIIIVSTKQFYWMISTSNIWIISDVWRI